MKVLKFGGTSVGTVETLRNVKSIVRSCAGEQTVVVVSALGGLTDKLIATANKAAAGDASWRTDHAAMIERHLHIIDTLIPESKHDAVAKAVGYLLSQLGDDYAALAAEAAGTVATPVMDRIVSYGERCSSAIVANMIEGAERFNSMNFIKTVDRKDRHALDNEASQPLIRRTFEGWEGEIAVVPGFISRDSADDHITNLGRGGSDYTAAILAAALGARVLEIWTDVDGFLSADPRIIDTTRVIDTMTFVEAMDLCNFGAKVVYPPTIYPVFHKNIPIYIKNTFNPDAPGTRIAEQAARYGSGPAFKGISAKGDFRMITLEGPKIDRVRDLDSRILNAPGRASIDIFPVVTMPLTQAPRVALAVEDSSADEAVRTLRDEFAAEISDGLISDITVKHGVAKVAAVGHTLRHDLAYASQLAELMAGEGLTMLAVSRAESDTNIAFLVSSTELPAALRIVHDAMISI